MNKFSRGAWAGIIATSAMTLVFLELFKSLPEYEKTSLPPGTLTDDTLRLTGTEHLTDSSLRQDLTLLAHYGYGIVFGVLFSFIRAKDSPTTFREGIWYGSAVWAASYLGWIPLMNFRSSAAKMSFRRNLLMVAAHVVWGATLGYTDKRLRKDSKSAFDGKTSLINI